MPETYAIPWPVCFAAATAMSGVIGVLWARLIAKEDSHVKEVRALMDRNAQDQREITDRYHGLVVALHRSIEFNDQPGPGGNGAESVR